MTTLHTINSHTIKEGIKNSITSVFVLGGAIALYEMTQTRDKVVLLLQASVLLNALASRPALCIWEAGLHQIATPETFTRLFGPNTIFEQNPRHPRHIVNIAVNALSAVALLQWIYCRYTKKPPTISRKVQAMLILNFIFGRSTLHIGNDLLYWAFSTKRK